MGDEVRRRGAGIVCGRSTPHACLIQSKALATKLKKSVLQDHRDRKYYQLEVHKVTDESMEIQRLSHDLYGGPEPKVLLGPWTLDESLMNADLFFLF